MALSHGAKIVTDGLVFAYDMNNTLKSWKGAPTTNVVTNTNLNTGWSQGYNTSILFNDYPPPIGIDSQVVSFIDADGNGSGYWYSYGDYAPQNPSTTYCISVWVRTIGNGFTLRAYTANNSETGRQYTNQLTCPGDGQWHRLEFNPITTPSNTTSDSLSFNFTSIPANQRCWLCAPQMTASSIHYPFVAGTRSSTQSVLDWTGNNTLTVSNLTFNADGTFKFNNSSSVITMPNTTALNPTTSLSIEALVNFDGNSADFIFEKGNVNTQYSLFSHGTDIVFRTKHVGDSSYNSLGPSKSAAGISNGVPVHIVGAWDGSTKRIYVNGIERSSAGKTGNLVTTSPGASVGRFGGTTTGYYFGGYIYAVRVYNQSLSPTEIQQNFAAIRGRYGI